MRLLQLLSTIFLVLLQIFVTPSPSPTTLTPAFPSSFLATSANISKPGFCQMFIVIGNNPSPWAYIDSVDSQPALMVEQPGPLAYSLHKSTHKLVHAINWQDTLLDLAWFCLNTIFEYLSSSIPAVIYCCVLSYSCSNNHVLELCLALSLRMLRFMTLKHEYSNKVKTLIPLLSYNISAIAFLLMFGLQFLLTLYVSGLAYNTTMAGHHSWSSISEWYTYELLVTNKLIKTPPLPETYLHSITHWYGCYCQEMSVIGHPQQFVGGGKKDISLGEIKPYITPYCLTPQDGTSVNYKYVNQYVLQAAQAEFRKNPELLICHVPLEILKGRVTLGQAKAIAKMHNIPIPSKSPVAAVMEILTEHMCSSQCSRYYTVFIPEKLVLTSSERQAKWYKGLSKADRKKN